MNNSTCAHDEGLYQGNTLVYYYTSQISVLIVAVTKKIMAGSLLCLDEDGVSFPSCTIDR